MYFFTDFFYKVFFATNVENLFFVRQVGTFLFLTGLFYMYPLLNLRILYKLILLASIFKIVAVIFLTSNAKYTTVPMMVYLAALFDGLMAMMLATVYFRLKKYVSLTECGISNAKESSL